MLNMMNRGFMPYQPAESGGPAMMRFLPTGDASEDVNTTYGGFPSSFAPPMPSSFQPPAPMPTFDMGGIGSMTDQFGPGQPMFGQPFNQMNLGGTRRPVSISGGGASRTAMSPLNMMLRRARGMRSSAFGNGANRSFGRSFGQSFGQPSIESDFSGLSSFNQTF
jgi:hypothetical protein